MLQLIPVNMNQLILYKLTSMSHFMINDQNILSIFIYPIKFYKFVFYNIL